MQNYRFSNNYIGTIAVSVGINTTELILEDVSGLPTITGDQFMVLTLMTPEKDRLEIVKVTAVTGNTLTMERGQEGTVAQSFVSGSTASLRLTAAALNEVFEGDTFSDAPADGVFYGRQNNAWAAVAGVGPEQNTPGALKLACVTQAEYDALAPPDANTLYFING